MSRGFEEVNPYQASQGVSPENKEQFEWARTRVISCINLMSHYLYLMEQNKTTEAEVQKNNMEVEFQEIATRYGITGISIFRSVSEENRVWRQQLHDRSHGSKHPFWKKKVYFPFPISFPDLPLEFSKDGQVALVIQRILDEFDRWLRGSKLSSL